MTPELRGLVKRLSRIERRLVEQDQRLARTILHGKVSAMRQQAGDWQVRLDMGDGVLSPWAPVQPVSAGALKIKARPTVGERMTLLSPSGVVGSGSWAIRAPFDQDHPAPAGDADVVLEVGATRITVEDGRLVLETGEGRIEMSGGDITVNGKTAFTGETLTHQGRSISHTHRHTNVMAGLGTSGPPQ